MESKRFEIVASTKELVPLDGKNAIRIELQYGKDGEPTELVIAELYSKDGKWSYTRSQVRIDCTKANIQHVLTCTKEMYESSLKVEKKATAKTDKLASAIGTMSDEDKAALLKILLGDAKTESTSKASKPATKTTESSELTLENFVLGINKKSTKK